MLHQSKPIPIGLWLIIEIRDRLPFEFCKNLFFNCNEIRSKVNSSNAGEQRLVLPLSAEKN